MTARLHISTWLALSLFALSGMACQETPAAPSTKTKLIITGSSTIAPMIAEIGKRYEARRPGIRIDVQTGGSSRGIADVRHGLADIGMVSRSLKTAERNLLGRVLAHDGIGLIVHRANPVSSLDHDTIVQIYTGQLTNWKETGGVDAPITVISKAEGRATLDLFLRHFQLTSRQLKAHVIIGDNEQGIKAVTGNIHAIAYVSIGTAAYDAAHDVPVKLLSLGSIPATLAAVQSGRFPLARPLMLVTKSIPQGQVKDFIDFSTSSDIHDIVARHYFVPLEG